MSKQLQEGDQFILPYGAELIPKQTLIQLESKSHVGNPVFVIHEISGSVSSLETVARSFDRPVWGVQCIEKAPAANCTELAKYYINEIKKVQGTGPYTIIGYSYGALVGFEVGVELEKSGENVKLYLIDGSPGYVSSLMQRIVNQESLVKIDNNIDDALDLYLKVLSLYVSKLTPTARFSEVIGFVFFYFKMRLNLNLVIS